MPVGSESGFITFKHTAINRKIRTSYGMKHKYSYRKLLIEAQLIIPLQRGKTAVYKYSLYAYVMFPTTESHAIINQLINNMWTEFARKQFCKL